MAHPDPGYPPTVQETNAWSFKKWFYVFYEWVRWRGKIRERFPNLLTITGTHAGSSGATAGTLTSGRVNNLQAIGGTDVVVNEVVANPGFIFYFDFPDAYGARDLVFLGKYIGSAAHQVNVRCQIYDYVNSSWDSLSENFVSNDAFRWYHFGWETDNYTSSTGVTSIRFIHNTTGNASHTFSIDYMCIR